MLHAVFQLFLGDEPQFLAQSILCLFWFIIPLPQLLSSHLILFFLVHHLRSSGPSWMAKSGFGGCISTLGDGPEVAVPCSLGTPNYGSPMDLIQISHGSPMDFLDPHWIENSSQIFASPFKGPTTACLRSGPLRLGSRIGRASRRAWQLWSCRHFSLFFHFFPRVGGSL